MLHSFVYWNGFEEGVNLTLEILRTGLKNAKEARRRVAHLDHNWDSTIHTYEFLIGYVQQESAKKIQGG